MPKNHGVLESKIEDWLNDRIRELGGISRKFISPGNPGVPDRIYITPDGRIYFVELKRIIGKLSNVQVWQREKFREMGVEVRVIYGMDQAKEFIKELKHEIQTTRLPGTGD